MSVVVGELVPKRIALLKPERIASFVARPLEIVVLIARPLVWFLENSTALLLWILRVPERRSDNVTEEEVKLAIAEGTEAGVIDEVEEQMIHGVLALADKGWRRALAEDVHLRDGLNVAFGKVTCEPVAQALGYPYLPAERALQ